MTGSTDGIGKAAAQYLARQGFNIVLISRTQAKLDAVSKEIEEETGVKTKTVQFNFTEKYSAEDYAALYDDHL